VLQHPFLKKASTDINELIRAWRASKLDASEEGRTSPQALDRQHERSQVHECNERSQVHERNERSQVHERNERSTSAVSAGTSSHTASNPLPIHPRMPPSSLLSISLDDMQASPSHLSSVHSNASSLNSVPPDYPDLPSLTMPVSIRRAYSSATSLHAQCRVQTLSAAADQSWQDPAGGGLMRVSTLQQPVAASSETREEARAIQFARPQQGMLSAMLSDCAEHHPATFKSLLSGVDPYSSHVMAADLRDANVSSFPPTIPEDGAVASTPVVDPCLEGAASGGGSTSPSGGPFVVGSAPAQFLVMEEEDAGDECHTLTPTAASALCLGTSPRSPPGSARSMPGGAMHIGHSSFASAAVAVWPDEPARSSLPNSSPGTALLESALSPLPPTRHKQRQVASAQDCYLDMAVPQRRGTLSESPPMLALTEPFVLDERPAIQGDRTLKAASTLPPRFRPPIDVTIQNSASMPCSSRQPLSANQRTSLDSRRILQSLLVDRGHR
jgi:hypothetical protein